MIGLCDICHWPGFNLIQETVMTGPGSGRTYQIHKNCKNKLPKSFKEIYGFIQPRDSKAKFKRFVGTPRITEAKYGNNAYGSVLAEHTDGSRIGVMCGHGGSAWLCLECAEKIIKNG